MVERILSLTDLWSSHPLFLGNIFHLSSCVTSAADVVVIVVVVVVVDAVGGNRP